MKNKRIRGEDRACLTCGDSYRWHHSLPMKKFCSKTCYNGYRLTDKGRLDLFWSNVVKTDTCWLYESSVKPEGYAFFRVGGVGNYKQWYAHRFSYELHHGQVPDGMDVCHTCDVRNCVRPDHLFPGTHDDNMADMISKGRHTLGERNYWAKMTEAQVLEIRAAYTGKRGEQVALARKYGVSNGVVTSIVNRKTWRHI